MTLPATITSPRSVSLRTVSSRRRANPLCGTGQGPVPAESAAAHVGAAIVVISVRRAGKVRAGRVSTCAESPGRSPPRTRTSLKPSLNRSSSTPAEYDDSRSSHDQP